MVLEILKTVVQLQNSFQLDVTPANRVAFRVDPRNRQLRSRIMTIQAADLTRKHCKPCEGGVVPLTAEQVKSLRPAVPSWHTTAEGKALRREWTVKDFATALDFFQRIGEVAEAQDHHPDLHLTGYRKVAIELSTHALGGLSENDFILAAKIDQLPVKLKE